MAPVPLSPRTLQPLQQSPLYRAALARIGVQAAWHDLPGGSALVLGRDLPVVGRVALISRPPALPGTGLGNLRRALGARALIVNAETPQDGAALARAGFVRLARPMRIAELSLDGTGADWLARMDGKWRNRLRHGMRQGLAIRETALPPDPRHWLVHRDAEQQAARGYRGLPPALITALAAEASGAMRLFTARSGDRTVAAMLFALHGGTASYLIGWSDPAGRMASAHNRLLWEAMGSLAAQGAQAIDLGICDSASAPGLARFKQGSGAGVRPLGGTWGAAAITGPIHALLRRVRGLPAAMPGTARTRPAAGRCTGRGECS